MRKTFKLLCLSNSFDYDGYSRNSSCILNLFIFDGVIGTTALNIEGENVNHADVGQKVLEKRMTYCGKTETIKQNIIRLTCLRR